MQVSNPVRSSRTRLLVVAALAAVVVLVGGIALFLSGAQASRQAEIAVRGAAVMPFDLEQTTHIFEDRPDGGIQQVVAHDPSDSTQIGLIRSHLQAEAVKFSQGDFGDPAAIHGHDMPGLAELRTGYAQIEVMYRELPNGAEISYRTSDQVMVTALHSWFAAQLSDHGNHAMDH